MPVINSSNLIDKILSVVNTGIKCPYCGSRDVIKNLFNFEPDKPKSIYSDYQCLDCDTDFEGDNHG